MYLPLPYYEYIYACGTVVSWIEGLALTSLELGELTVVMVVSTRGGPLPLLGLERLAALMVVLTNGLSSLFHDLVGLTAVIGFWAGFVSVPQGLSAMYEYRWRSSCGELSR